jgi:F0F1-type ATP synthase assembly protein I
MMSCQMPGTFHRGMQYTHIGLAIPACTLAGLFFGWLLDSWLHTNWIYLVGLLLGVVAGFYEIIRAVKQMNQPPDAPQVSSDDES